MMSYFRPFFCHKKWRPKKGFYFEVRVAAPRSAETEIMIFLRILRLGQELGWWWLWRRKNEVKGFHLWSSLIHKCRPRTYLLLLFVARPFFGIYLQWSFRAFRGSSVITLTTFIERSGSSVTNPRHKTVKHTHYNADKRLTLDFQGWKTSGAFDHYLSVG